MKSIFRLMVLILLIPLAVSAQDTTPSPLPPPTLTTTPYTPPPPPTATSTPLAGVLTLPALQAINRDNLGERILLGRIDCGFDTPGGLSDVRDVVWSVQGRRLAAVAFNAVCLYDFDLPDSEPLILTPTDTWAAVFSPDGTTLATLHNGDSNVRLWDVASGEEKPTTLTANYIMSGNEPPTLAYSPDGRYIATVSGGSLRLYDAVTEIVLVQVRGAFGWGVMFSGDSQRLITVERNTLKLWTLHPGPLLYQDQTVPIPESNCPFFSCRVLAVGGENQNIMALPAEEGVALYDLSQDEIIGVVGWPPMLLFLPDGDLLPPFDTMTEAEYTGSNHAAISADGTLWAGIGSDGLVEIYGVPE